MLSNHDPVMLSNHVAVLCSPPLLSDMLAISDLSRTCCTPGRGYLPDFNGRSKAGGPEMVRELYEVFFTNVRSVKGGDRVAQGSGLSFDQPYSLPLAQKCDGGCYPDVLNPAATCFYRPTAQHRRCCCNHGNMFPLMCHVLVKPDGECQTIPPDSLLLNRAVGAHRTQTCSSNSPHHESAKAPQGVQRDRRSIASNRCPGSAESLGGSCGRLRGVSGLMRTTRSTFRVSAASCLPFRLFSKTSTQVRKLGDSVDVLERRLAAMESRPVDYAVGQGELARRRAALDNLRQQLSAARGSMSTGAGERGGGGGGGGDGGGASRLEQQRETMREHERMLADLGRGVGRLKTQSVMINEETSLHVRLLDDMEGDAERASSGLQTEARHAEKIRAKSKTFNLYVIIAVLSVILIILIFSGI
ncbi:unnamed protein product [Scytosiphon promiscuus]